jgi:O-antigen/teichoic acid export membrane protein
MSTVVPRRSLVRSAPAIAAATAIANALGYALNLFASRVLGPIGYGELASFLALVLIGSVLAVALQTVVARRTAVAVAAGAPAAWHRLRPAALAAALLLGAFVAAVAPVLAGFLHLRSPLPVRLVGAVLVPLTYAGLLQGALQGEERFGRLAAALVVIAAGKVGGAVLGVAVRPSATAAVVGMAIGSVIAIALVMALARERGREDAPGVSDNAGIGVETLHAGSALLALYALTSLDVLLARHRLSRHDAGIYAVGAVIAKGAFWLPQFVGILAFSRAVDPTHRRRTVRSAIAVVTGLGVAVTLGTALFGRLAVRVVGGAQYDALTPHAWLFAALGSALAVVALVVGFRLARGDRWSAPALVTAAGAQVALVLVLGRSITSVVTATLAVMLLVALLGVLGEGRHATEIAVAEATVAAPIEPG